MAVFNLLSKVGNQDDWYLFSKLTLFLKEQAKKDGIDDLDFPKYMEDQGARAVGPLIIVDDSLIEFAKLKWQRS